MHTHFLYLYSHTNLHIQIYVLQNCYMLQIFMTTYAFDILQLHYTIESVMTVIIAVLFNH